MRSDYGDVYRRRERIIFVYDDMNQEVWDESWGCVIPERFARSTRT